MTEPWDGDLTGQTVAGRYLVGSVIGTGGMAEVYRAHDQRLDRSVAIKVFDASAAPEDVIRLEREARMLSSLHCRGVVTVYEFGAHERRPYYVMQEIKGGTLRQRMRDPLPPAFVARVGAQVAQILDYVHEVGVVHRDIKPSNILLDDSLKQAYLADFGLALQAHVTRVTRSGVLVGTAGYLAPEQVRGSTVGPRADVYALGLVLLECLTGRPEYPGGDAEAALARLSRLPRIPSMLPREWVTLLQGMTHLDPERRLSAADCVERLRAVQEVSKSLPALEVSYVETVPEQRRSSRKVGYALAAAAAAATAVAVVAVNLGGTAAPAGGSDQTTSTPPPSPVTETVSVSGSAPSTITVVRTQDGRPVNNQPVAPTTTTTTEEEPTTEPTDEPTTEPPEPTKPTRPTKPTKTNGREG